MIRVALYVGGLTAAVAAFVLWRDRARATRRVPAKEAADLLRRAWADHHTTA